MWAVDPAAPNAAGQEAPAARNLTDAKGARAFIYAVPKKSPDTIYVGLNDRDAAWHDVYKVTISTGQRELLRKNTERIAGWDFDLDGRLRLATRVADNGDTEILKVEPEGYKKVYSCTVFETCGPDRFHKDGRRVYMQTNKGDVDLTRLVLFDPETGAEELVESDPLNRVDFGAAIFSEATDELVGTSYEDERTRVYFHDKAWEADYRLLQAKFPGKEIGLGVLDRRRLEVADHRCERHRARRALHLRPRHEGAHAAVQGPRAHPAPAHGADEGGPLPLVGRRSRSRPSSRCRRASRRRTCRRSSCPTAGRGRATAGASTTSRSSSPTAATPC